MTDQHRAPPRSIDYYFTLVSPWSYIGHAVFTAVRQRNGCLVRYHPVALSTVFPESGGLPLAKRHPLRQSYRMLELQRWRERRGLRFHLRPRFWPFDATLADCAVLALRDSGADLERFLPSAYAAVWEQERDLADPEVLSELLEQGGFDPSPVLAAARSQPERDRYDAETRDAIAAGVFGAPTYRLDGEIFWGQDRLDLLDDALTSGRAAFRP